MEIWAQRDVNVHLQAPSPLRKSPMVLKKRLTDELVCVCVCGCVGVWVCGCVRVCEGVRVCVSAALVQQEPPAPVHALVSKKKRALGLTLAGDELEEEEEEEEDADDAAGGPQIAGVICM